MNVFLENGITCLDLHGERHHDVPDISIDFVYRHQAQLPLLIICGNSQRMITLVEDKLKSNSIGFSSPRFGIIRVEKI
tara:strand:- start:752 stop:985 length:234 start_codon:yes stop_codon:yes gene_type:complete